MEMNFPKMEEEVLKKWKEQRAFEKSLQLRKRGRRFVFYEGPPTANGAPGLHHVLSRVYKDVVCRYKTMRGFYVPRKAGWDTHGLPVEIQVEKKLGFKSKQDIENYGIAKFNAEAKKSVWEYKEEWERLTKRMGFWIDLKNPYITYDTSYIETLWRIIKEFWEKGLLYEDFKVVPWCPRCQTGLSSHEVGQGYKEVEDTAVYVKFKLKPNQKIGNFTTDDRTCILSWTTTPWTLPGNVALAVGEGIEYVLAELGGERIIIAAARLDAVVGEKARIVKKVSAKDLSGLVYEPLFYVRELQSEKSHRVYTAPFVSADEGTGIVHTAVMYGEDDYRLGSDVGLPRFHTVTEDGRFIVELGEKKDCRHIVRSNSVCTVCTLGGMAVKDKATEEKILKILEAKNLLFAKEKYRHEYPHCWRCETPLLYYARKAWWVKTTAVKKELIANNEKVNWVPEHIKHGRFGEFLRDLRDWAFSRERYWGTPLPIWKCENENCVGMTVIGSLAELKDHSDRLPLDENEEVNLHRPYVDELTFDCKKCGGLMRRTPEVADVWFDSGAMPFAQGHWPFAQIQKSKIKNQNLGRNLLYPADYICEAVDQTRGWFYTLLAVGTLLGKGPAYKNVISLGHVLDKNGQKMSKSKGNVVNPQEIMSQYGADALRWYFYTVNAPGDPKNFDEKDVTLRRRGFVATLWNSFVFWDTYVKKIPNPKSQIPNKFQTPNSKNILDQWVAIRMDALVRDVTEKVEAYDIVGAARLLDEFVINDFSQWYIRRSRRRFQHPETAEEKKEAAATGGYVLWTLSKLCAPFTPFLAEAIWQALREKTGLKERSVHLAEWPTASRRQEAGGRRMLEDMDAVREIATQALKLRAEAGIKVRQPLAKLQITDRRLQKKNELLDLVKEEINVKEIIFGKEASLDTEITPELKEEGIVREFVRAAQDMRRDLGLKPKEVIRCQVSGARLIEEIIEKWQREIKKQINASQIKVGGKRVFRIEREIQFEEGMIWIGIS